MKLGIVMPIGLGNGNPEFLAGLGPALEERGFESIWVPEHVVLFDEYASRYPLSKDGRIPMPADAGLVDPFVALSFLAAGTKQLRLGTGVCLAGQRNPVYTAKYVADLDVLSGGRVDFGIGIGWLREEYEALGVPWAGRGARTDDHLQVMKSLWSDAVSAKVTASFELPACRMYPKPIQQPHPPVHIGGHSDAALRRVAQHGNGWFAMGHPIDELAQRLSALDAALSDAGRSRADITVSVSPPADAGAAPIDRELAARYVDLGVDRLIAPLFARRLDKMTALLDRTADELLPACEGSPA